MASTPARNTRSKSIDPLPALDPRQSFAYGARGKAVLRTQIARPGDDFASAFATARGEAPAEEEDMPPAVQQPAGSSRRRKAAALATVAENERASPAASTARDGTVVDAQAGYEPPAASSSRPPPLNAPAVTAAAAAAVAAANPAGDPNDDRRQAEPWGISVTRFNWWRPLRWPSSILIAYLLFWFGFTLPLPSPLAEVRDNWRIWLQPPSKVEELYSYFRHEHIFRMSDLPAYNMPADQWMVNLNFQSRIERLENRVDLLENSVHLLESILPDKVVVEADDGKLVIPQQFWIALQHKLDGDSTFWDAFVGSNEMRLQKLVSSYFDQNAENLNDKYRVVSRQTFNDLIVQNNEHIMANYAKELEQYQEKNILQTKEVAERVASRVVEGGIGSTWARSQLDLLAKGNMLHNAYEAMRTVNWFSPDLGAKIDIRYTSPTVRRRQKNMLAQGIANLPFGLHENRPITALLPWKEAAEAWCTSDTKDQGKGQLTVWLPERVRPERLVVEHIPAQGTLDIAAAPKDFEVWVKTENPKQAAQFNAILDDTDPARKLFPCGKSPSDEYICFLTGSYDIHNNNWVQTFTASPEFIQLGINTDSVTIRATSNWGADHTCFYRLRLTGNRQDHSNRHGVISVEGGDSSTNGQIFH